MDRDDTIGFLTTQIAIMSQLSESYTQNPRTKEKYLYRPIFYRVNKAVGNFINSTDLQNRVIIIPGLRGVGKTTVLWQIYEKFSKNATMIYLSCHHLNNYGIDLMDALRTYENKFLGVPLELFNGKLVLLIDEAHAQKNWAAIIKDVYDRSKNVFVIISTCQ